MSMDMLSVSNIKQRIEQQSIPEPNSGCWLWTGHLNDSGYGMVSMGRRKTLRRAHRVSYEVFVGPIPEGLELDHKCRVRSCVNPAHLEAVTRQENLRRSPLTWQHMPEVWERLRSATHCKRGHLRAEFANKHGGCRECARILLRIKRGSDPDAPKTNHGRKPATGLDFA